MSVRVLRCWFFTYSHITAGNNKFNINSTNTVFDVIHTDTKRIKNLCAKSYYGIVYVHSAAMHTKSLCKWKNYFWRQWKAQVKLMLWIDGGCFNNDNKDINTCLIMKLWSQQWQLFMAIIKFLSRKTVILYYFLDIIRSQECSMYLYLITKLIYQPSCTYKYIYIYCIYICIYMLRSRVVCYPKIKHNPRVLVFIQYFVLYLVWCFHFKLYKYM